MACKRIFKGLHAVETPTYVEDDSGFDSMLQTSTCKHPKYKKFCTSAKSSKYSYVGRLKILSVDNVKKKLLFDSPYSSERSRKGSLRSSTDQYKMQQMVAEDDAMQVSYTEEKTVEKLPDLPVKFFYSPSKNSKLFQIAKPSTQKSAVSQTGCAPNAKSWGTSLSLPELRHDLLKKLADTDSFILSFILSYLPDKDLYQASCTSRTWKQIVLNDSKACKRRQNYLDRRLAYKENQKDAIDVEVLMPRMTEGERELLLNMVNRNLFKHSKPSKALMSKSEKFLTIAKKLRKGEVILKCPMCQHPAKRLKNDNYRCTHNSCCYTFCRKCFGLHDSQNCPDPDPFSTDLIVGSKQSRWNLRRL